LIENPIITVSAVQLSKSQPNLINTFLEHQQYSWRNQLIWQRQALTVSLSLTCQKCPANHQSSFCQYC